MSAQRPQHTRRQALLLVVAVLLSASALLAIGILLFGRFGRTESRILGTTAMLAGFTLLTVPAAMLLDRRRLRGLAAATFPLAGAGAALATVTIWMNHPSDSLGRTVGTVVAVLLAATQTSALAVRRAPRDPASVRSLFFASVGLAAVVAAMWSVVMWLGDDVGSVFPRVLAALAVLDLLVVALQPILARARPEPLTVRLRVRVDSGETIEVTVEAPDLAGAAAKAIRQVESRGARVRALEVPAAAPQTRSHPYTMRARSSVR